MREKKKKGKKKGKSQKEEEPLEGPPQGSWIVHMARPYGSDEVSAHCAIGQQAPASVEMQQVVCLFWVWADDRWTISELALKRIIVAFPQFQLPGQTEESSKGPGGSMGMDALLVSFLAGSEWVSVRQVTMMTIRRRH